MMNRRIFLAMLMPIITALACSLTPPSGPQNVGTPGAGATPAELQLTAAVQGTAPSLASTDTPAPQPSGAGAGLRVVYSQNGNIRLWDASGPRQLTGSGQDSAPKISDDGAVVAFLHNGELWAVNTDGANQRVLASAATLAALPHPDGGALLQPRQFDFAPASHDIYFNTLQIGNPFSVPQYDLVKVNADSPALQSLLNNDQGGAEFTFSPDGTKIALARNDRINVANADGSGLKTVFHFPFVSMYSEAGYAPQVVWLPDASGFKTVIPAQDALANPSAPSRFMFIPADGSQAAQLAEFVAAPAFANRPYISPDGAKVLYVRPQGANLEMHIIDASTADQMVFWHAASNVGILGWAPDSVHAVYWIDDSRRTWLVSQGAEAVPLSDVTFADKVTWVDADRYLFLNETELRIRTLGQPSILIEGGMGDGFDFSLASY